MAGMSIRCAGGSPSRSALSSLNADGLWQTAVGTCWRVVAITAIVAQAQSIVSAQEKTAGQALPLALVGDQVLIKREPAQLVDPAKYRVSLVVRPHRLVEITAPCDGVVRQIVCKPAAVLSDQGEMLRLDNTEQKLLLQRAKALYRSSQLELKRAESADETTLEAARARSEAAETDVAIAQLQYDRCSVRAPFNGEVLRVLVDEGQYVRAGEPLVSFGDSSKLTVEAPVDRKLVQKDAPFGLKIEADDVQGKVAALLPLHERFSPLRDLFESVSSAVISIENPGGKFRPGQSVFVPMIPRHPVAETPTSAVGNLVDGQRRVQVVRLQVVRDIPVSVLGAVGATRVFVSGPFAPGDEVIYESSHQMNDGFQIRPAAKTGAETEPGKPAATRPAAPTPGASAF